MNYKNAILGQMLQLFPRLELHKFVKDTSTEHHTRGFTSWNYFVPMLFGQFTSTPFFRLT